MRQANDDDDDAPSLADISNDDSISSTDSDADDPRLVEVPTYIEPSFDLSKLRQRLLDPKTVQREKMAMLLGLHIKFWHAPASDMVRFLRKGGYDSDTLQMVHTVVPWMCEQCMAWRRTMTRPQHKMSLSPHFNFRVHTDLFFIFDERCYIILVDDCIRYALVAHLERKTPDEWLRTVFLLWIRYFGPMWYLMTDQEGAVVSNLVAKACEKYGIEREFGGSQGHTSAPVAERRIEIVRLAAQKLYSSAQKYGWNVTQDDCVFEACMSSNLMLSYGGHTPSQALTGIQP